MARSVTQAESMNLYSTNQEFVWLRLLLKYKSYTDQESTTIFQDNQGCIALARNPVYHARTKHIEIKFYFLREKFLNEVIAL